MGTFFCVVGVNETVVSSNLHGANETVVSSHPRRGVGSESVRSDHYETVVSSNLRRGISSDHYESVDLSYPRGGIHSGEGEPEMENDQPYLVEEALEEGKAPDIKAEIAAVERELMMELEKESIIS